MEKVFYSVVLLTLGCAKVQAQSATANITITGIENLKVQALATLSRPFNILKDELAGHFFRSSTAIRLGRSTLFATTSNFPYYQLTSSTREQLKGNLTNIISNCADPTIEYLQKDAMKSFFNLTKDSCTPIERALQPAFDQLSELETAIKNADNETCLIAVNVNNMNLTATYANFTNAIDACTSNASASYRVPITDFVEDNFNAFPVLTAMNFNLAGCVILTFTTEECAKLFLVTYSDSCSSITAIRDQAKSMVETSQTSYEACLKATKDFLPVSTPYLAAVSACKSQTV